MRPGRHKNERSRRHDLYRRLQLRVIPPRIGCTIAHHAQRALIQMVTKRKRPHRQTIAFWRMPTRQSKMMLTIAHASPRSGLLQLDRRGGPGGVRPRLRDWRRYSCQVRVLSGAHLEQFDLTPKRSSLDDRNERRVVGKGSRCCARQGPCRWQHAVRSQEPADQMRWR